VQGAGQGFITVPLSTIALATLAPEHRAEGAGMFNLARTMGSSVGISVVNSLLTYNVQVNHANIAEDVTAFTRTLSAPHISTFWNPLTEGGRASLDSVINQQAQLISYNNDYKLLMLATLVTLPLLLIIKKPAKITSDSPAPAE
jgi:MFS transporter, DHA2 family, multidrug resistance protein